MDWCALFAQPSALESYQICPEEKPGLAGFNRRSGITPCPEDQVKGSITKNLWLVNIFKKYYNIFIMKPIIKQVHRTLLKKKIKVSVAESCTGGLISSLLTHLTGSSRYFILGVVVYSNLAKIKILKIPAALIGQKGAVSKEVAREMAKSVRLASKSNLGIAVTGIAGPDGASKEKPKGTVFIALDTPKEKKCLRYRFSGNRQSVRKQAALKSLKLIKRIIDK